MITFVNPIIKAMKGGVNNEHSKGTKGSSLHSGCD